MSFYASNFVYNGISSAEFGLTISNFNESTSTTNGANVSLSTETIYRRAKPYLFGVQETPVLEIPITITVSDELTAQEASTISRWLFGQMDYKKLQIIQPDMQYIYFNCIFTNPQVIRIGNIIRGFNANITCDSPFAWEFPTQTIYSYDTNTYSISETVTYNNTSDSADYTYPVIEIGVNKYGGDISIINLTDNSRTCTFTDLNSNEIVTVDNDLQIIQSTVSGENRLEDFNYQWFRVVPNINKITLSGAIYYLRIINNFARKIA